MMVIIGAKCKLRSSNLAKSWLLPHIERSKASVGANGFSRGQLSLRDGTVEANTPPIKTNALVRLEGRVL